MPVEYSELELVWPAALFTAEATELLDSGLDDEETMGWLLAEAFHGDRGYQLFAELRRAKLWVALGSAVENINAAQQGNLDVARARHAVNPATDLVKTLIRDATALPRYRPRRYYSQRQRARQADPMMTRPELRSAFVRTVIQLEIAGYFEGAFGSRCPDARGDNPAEEGQRILSGAIGTDAPLWPLTHLGELTGIEQTWDEDLFFDVVEALHDLIARPRRRVWHEYHREHDYTDFARRPGQAVYRWRVNELLARAAVPLRLANSGPDTGLLVQPTGDPRDQLTERALTTSDPAERDEVAHSVALFRRRDATREDKRSAVVAIARVLEHQRTLLKNTLLSKDERALFAIANGFDLRHRNADQRSDYDEAFLDWVFWWYLGTVELTTSLVARPAPPTRQRG
ncbi:hypothetical protein E9529_20215 [Blastococcus sp. KM273128]|uniref:hypothetical protein n=1 Tax=Blastococcus sp. KM273128 TaxID=2570314 RepID=UPI001F24C491|nr:hypothetical protein [Blastococcus sp. KM273128]MCF6746557.1 hypothetical protein [Blastococcus sp. KM273128]